MRGPTKMFLVSGKMDPRRRGDDRVRMMDDPPETHYPGRMPYYPPYGDERGGEPENRFRDRRGREHYDNGRFSPRNGPEDWPESYTPEMRGPMMRGGDLGDVRTEPTRPPMQIGFRYEEDPTRYRANVNYPRMNEGEHRTSPMERGRAESHMMRPMDKQTAEEWARKMRNSDGSIGPHWKMEQVKQVMQQKGIDKDPIEFYVTMNMLYSDYGQVAKTHGINSVDFYIDLAKAFLDDPDAGDDKLLKYYEYIVNG